MLRFRGFREAESPEPLDLIVVSTFRGMAGMDASNRTPRERAEKANTSMGELYGRIGALTEKRQFQVCAARHAREELPKENSPR